MHLKKIEIQGFKSFPEYTLIEFDKGMTAIVGPNGSGKSNVTDAVRWVLGEQSVRTLRGGKMEDVIFNGTQSRRAMNYAEVSITIDNSDGVLEIDFSEVQITRRLYRSGESEYQINRVNCRLKDIVQLFMDTGLGRDGYSIVGQGRIDDILSSRSEDRRKVLEEASGIVKYKVRKEEAERKLLASEQNLIRICDILSELSEQIEPLKSQAEKARFYHRTYTEWKELDIGLTLHMIDRNQAFLSSSGDEYSDILEEIRIQEDAIIELRDKNRALTEKSSDIEVRLEELRDKKSDASSDIHKVLSDLAIIIDRKKQLRDRLLIGDGEDGNARNEIDRLDARIKDQELKISKLLSQKEKYDIELQTKESEMKELLVHIDQAHRRINESKIQAETLSEEIFELRNQYQTMISERMLFDSNIKSLTNERVVLISEKDKLSAMLDESESKLHSVTAHLANTKDAHNKAKDQLEILRDTAEEYRSSREVKLREKENLSFRKRTLTELEAGKEGYQEPVRRLFADAEKDESLFKKIVGIVGDLIRVEKQYETAIEIALGQSIHHIVTNNEDEAKEIIAYLKEKHYGRATFLPISVIRPRSLESKMKQTAQKQKGFIGVASDLVSYDSSLSGIVGNLLGRIIIVDHLSNAIDIARLTDYSFRLVTKEGDVVNPGGSLTGGSIRRQGTGILGRGRELEELSERILAVDEEILKCDELTKDSNDRIKECARNSLELDHLIREQMVLVAKAESERKGLRDDSDRIKKRLAIVEKELDSISTKRISIQNDMEELDQSVSEKDKEMNSLRSSLSKSDAEKAEIQARLDNLRSDISDMKISSESVAISLTGSEEVLELLKQEKQGFSAGLKKLLEEREHAKSEVVRLGEEEEIKTAIRDELMLKEDQITAQIKDLVITKEEIEQQLSGFIDRLSQASSRLSHFQTEHAKMEAKRERFLSEIDDYKNRLWEEHEITYDNAQSYRLEIEGVSSIQKRIAELRNEIREIGPVNANAIDEFTRVNERYEFLNKQKDDIEKARADLQNVINNLVSEMRRQFLEHFSIINDNFNSVFSDLFNGGTAEIILDDQEDVLSCNIDIRAQPPGKRLQSISLLSGGERCLTAIAILFAILQLRPSPFCVLDEVEAALDDVNINRFTEFVRRYTSKSQFILVTHRKGTMEACDRMYGVTMQERGISKILSMRLDQS